MSVDKQVMIKLYKYIGGLAEEDCSEDDLRKTIKGQKELKYFLVPPDDIQFKHRLTFDNLNELDSRKKEKSELYIFNTTNGYSKVTTI